MNAQRIRSALQSHEGYDHVYVDGTCVARVTYSEGVPFYGLTDEARSILLAASMLPWRV